VCHDPFADLECDLQRAETDFFTGEPLNALSTLVYSQNIDLQRSASLTFAEITERGEYMDMREKTWTLAHHFIQT
jgi:hypothetical protein